MKLKQRLSEKVENPLHPLVDDLADGLCHPLLQPPPLLLHVQPVPVLTVRQIRS